MFLQRLTQDWKPKLVALLFVASAAAGWAWWQGISWHALASGGLVQWQRQQYGIYSAANGKLSTCVDKGPLGADAHEVLATWYNPLFEKHSYVVMITCQKRSKSGEVKPEQSVSFWYRLDGKSRGADGKDLMGMFACSGTCAVPDGTWHLPNASGEVVCELTWCHGQICSVAWLSGE